MNAPDPEATGNDSRGARPAPSAERVHRFALLTRGFLALAGVAGVVLLVLTTRATVIQIRIAGSSATASGIDTTISGADRHGPAFIIVAVFAAIMLAGALSGARPAMAGVAAAGIVALGIAIASDAAHIHDTGPVGEVYTEARAEAGSGFYLETLGGTLLLISGGGLVLLGLGTGTSRAPRPPRVKAPRPPKRARPAKPAQPIKPERDSAEPVPHAEPAKEPAVPGPPASTRAGTPAPTSTPQPPRRVRLARDGTPIVPPAQDPPPARKADDWFSG